jgi:hypothetical protein
MIHIVPLQRGQPGLNHHIQREQTDLEANKCSYRSCPLNRPFKPEFARACRSSICGINLFHVSYYPVKPIMCMLQKFKHRHVGLGFAALEPQVSDQQYCALLYHLSTTPGAWSDTELIQSSRTQAFFVFGEPWERGCQCPTRSRSSAIFQLVFYLKDGTGFFGHDLGMITSDSSSEPLSTKSLMAPMIIFLTFPV